MSGDPRQTRNAMQAMESHLQSMVEPAEQQMRDSEQMIGHVTAMIEETMAALNRALDDAKDDLAHCESQVNDKGRRPDCSRFHRRVQKISRQIAHMVSMSQQFEHSVRRYNAAADGLREVIGQDIPTATYWLRDRERALEKFESGSIRANPHSGSRAKASSASSGPSIDALTTLGAAAVATGNSTLLSAFNSFFDGMGKHGYKYQKARQEYLRGLVNDPNQPRHVRGWIKQELNRIDAAKRAKAAGLQPPGRGSGNIRGIPGLDVGHRYPGLDHAANFRLEDAWVNRHRPIVARKLGIFHLFR